MAIHGKYLFQDTIKGILSGKDLSVAVYGLFNTEKVHWTYYVISTNTIPNKGTYLTNDICSVNHNNYYDLTYDSIKTFGKLFNSVAEGEKYLQDFKMKWESGSNNSTAEMRDKKLDEILKP